LSVSERPPVASQTARQTKAFARIPPEEDRPERQGGLSGGDRQRGRSNRLVVERPPARQHHHRDDRQRADEVANVDDQPRAEQPYRRDLPARDRHHHQVVAGEQFGACDHDEDQAKRERDPGEPPRSHPRDAGSTRGSQHCQPMNAYRTQARTPGSHRLRLRDAAPDQGRDLAGARVHPVIG
jgi:hypothetical protein